MAVLRLVRVCLHLADGLLTCALFFPWMGRETRMRQVGRWSRKLLAICGVKIRLAGGPARPSPLTGLVVANHVSWLDIFVLNSFQPCRFVAKSDIRSWPLIGWLCEKTGTIFIARGSIRDVRRIFVGLVEAIRKGESIAFFPEGTTAGQGNLLPFHANLFEAAIDAGVQVQPCSIRYLSPSGGFHQAADFIGETTFAESLWKIVNANGMVAELSVLEPFASQGAHRRDLANAAHDAIASALQINPVADIRDNPPGRVADLQV